MKEIHFIVDNIPGDQITALTFFETKKNIDAGYDLIYTTQMAFLCFDLLVIGYRIFIHQNNKIHEVKIGKNDFTPKELRKEHDLLNLWMSGSFNF